jgi:hypothetical protein
VLSHKENKPVLDYSRIGMPVSACVSFVRNTEIDGDELRAIAGDAKAKGIACAYLDYLQTRGGSEHIGDHIARVLELYHPPYGGAHNPWVPFLDDLIALSTEVNGMVLIIDNSDVFLKEKPRDLFDLIESFLLQFHHWFEKRKPCHLCLQMEKNEIIRLTFAE